MAAATDVAGAAVTLAGLQEAVNGKNVDKADALLVELKLAMLNFPALPPAPVASPTAAQELQIARDTFEAACVLSTIKGSSEEFDKHFIQLRPFYDSLQESVSPSTQRALVLGLNLLRLLVDNRLDAFHVELELLGEGDKANPLVAFPLELQQAMVQGYFDKATGASDASLPSPLYGPFVGALQDTARKEAADCCAAAYDSMSLAAAAQRLHLPSTEAAATYIAAEQPTWTVEGGQVKFAADGQKGPAPIPAQEVMHQTLQYATDLERIV